MDQRRAAEAEHVLATQFHGPEGMILKLRMNKGFDEEQYANVKQALTTLIEEYAEETMLPKSLVALLLDTSANLEAGWKFNDDATRTRVEDARDEVYALTEQLTGGDSIQ